MNENKILSKIREANGIVGKRIVEDADQEDYNEYYNRMANNPTFKKMKAICEKYGYNLLEAYNSKYPSGRLVPSITIRTVDRDSYHADIYHSHRTGWEIQTTAVGSLDLEKYEKYMKACQDSYEMVKELSDINLETLYVEEEE